MTNAPHDAVDGPVEPVFTALADGHRRQVLAVLDDRSGTATISELVQGLVSRRTETTPAVPSPHEPPSAPSPHEHRSIRTLLHHVHVPMLAEAGLVERTEEGVTLVETAVGRPVASLVEAPVAPSSLDEAFEVLAHRDRRAAIATLRRADQPLSVADVAEGVHKHSPDDRSTRELAISLAHVHLPKLDEVNVVEYVRSEGNTIEYARPEGHVSFDGLSLAYQVVLECVTGHLAQPPDRSDESASSDDETGVPEHRLLELSLT